MLGSGRRCAAAGTSPTNSPAQGPDRRLWLRERVRKRRVLDLRVCRSNHRDTSARPTSGRCALAGGRRRRRRGRDTRSNDPHTGRPPSGILAVTVVGPDLATADAFATAAYAMGTDGPAWTADLTEYGAMTIRRDDVVLTTEMFHSLQRGEPRAPLA